MKKIHLSLLILFVSLSSINSQNFELCPTGFKDSTKINNDYIVFNFTGKKQADLYNDAYVEITNKFASSDDVINTINGHSITIHTTSGNSVTFQKIYKYNLKYNLKYTLTFLFKDGRIRVNAPILNEISGDHLDLGLLNSLNSKNSIHLTGDNSMWLGEKSIFDENGKLKEEKAKEDLEHVFNTIISSIITSIRKYESQTW